MSAGGIVMAAHGAARGRARAGIDSGRAAKSDCRFSVGFPSESRRRAVSGLSGTRTPQVEGERARTEVSR